MTQRFSAKPSVATRVIPANILASVLFLSEPVLRAVSILGSLKALQGRLALLLEWVLDGFRAYVLSHSMLPPSIPKSGPDSKQWGICTEIDRGSEPWGPRLFQTEMAESTIIDYLLMNLWQMPHQEEFCVFLWPWNWAAKVLSAWPITSRWPLAAKNIFHLSPFKFLKIIMN